MRAIGGRDGGVEQRGVACEVHGYVAQSGVEGEDFGAVDGAGVFVGAVRALRDVAGVVAGRQFPRVDFVL